MHGGAAQRSIMRRFWAVEEGIRTKVNVLRQSGYDEWHPGYPLHRENRKNGQKNFTVRENTGNLDILSKHREFCLNTGKTQRILLAQVVNDSKSKGYCDIHFSPEAG